MAERRKLPEPTGPGAYPKVPGFEIVGYDVYSHSRDPVPGRSPADSVLFVLRATLNSSEFALAMRLKSRAAVDQLIDTLERHAVDVWPRNTTEEPKKAT